ncbi:MULTISPECIES: sugar transferase [Actibacterium]|nr:MULTISPECIES: sugar transferase [Actibacterium]ALG91645.1 sugar transferase [Actibacterium sp. EMB200-NS6]
MTMAKRLFDIALALVLGILMAPFLAVLLVAMWALDGRPLFYTSERMKGVDRPFRLWKLRTMKPDLADSGVSGGDKAHRVTRMGHVLRRFRLDEIPQLWNVLKGDMSFVGPRPPLRLYVERFPALYGEVLRSRPGITGLATLVYHSHEERLLARCKTAEDTDAVYSRACVPRKARLDLIYQKHQSLCGDIALLWQTAARMVRRR